MILLLTHSQDVYTIDGVEHHLNQRGVAYHRLNSDQFPAAYRLSVGPRGMVWLESEQQQLDLSQVKACWARRLWPGVVPESVPQACAQLSRAFFLQALSQLRQAFWVNDLAADLAAENKLEQLWLAEKFGLRVPTTLVTSSPTEALAFAENFPEGVITKLLQATVQSMEGHPDFAYTTRVDPEHWAGIAAIQWMPQIFQPYLRRRQEFRVIVVAGDFFVGRLHIDNPQVVDWRCASPEDGLHWHIGELSSALKGKILQMMQHLGLVYAAFDFLEVEPELEPYFLEVNPAGEWGWLERDLGLPIAARLARALVEAS